MKQAKPVLNWSWLLGILTLGCSTLDESPPLAKGAIAGRGGSAAGTGASGNSSGGHGATAGSAGTTLASGGSTRDGSGGGATAGQTSAAGGTAAPSTGGRNSSQGGSSRGGVAPANGGSASGGFGASTTGGRSNAIGGTTAGGRTGTTTGGQTTTAGGGATATGGTTGSPSGGSGALPTDTCSNAAGQLLPPDAPWNTSIASAPLDTESSAIISYLQTNHTASVRFRVDFSINLLTADATTPHLSFTQTGDFYDPDCDPAPPPVPPGGALEGESGYSCASDGDCHLLVIDRAECRLYEMWRANLAGSTFEGGCQAIWQLNQAYPASGRGENCTSADAAGLPVSALLFTADEVAAGEIRHAIRFILPNNLMRSLVYVHPATHSTNATAGPATAPPYGARMRLKASTSLTGLNSAAQAVARALQNYGMILSDAGNITFTAAGDTFTTHKWSEVGFGTSDLMSLAWSDFEVVDGGQRFTFTGNCERDPVTQ
jgi:hypothetical protein